MLAPRRSLSLLALGVLLTGATPAPSMDEAPQRTVADRIRESASQARTGALSEARLELASVLKVAPKEPGALMVQACVLLEQGALDAAAQTVARLREVAPEQAEGQVLEALVQLRRANPAGEWREAFIAAWIEAGRPDFGVESLLPEGTPGWGPVAIRAVWNGTQAPDTRFLAALMGGPSKEQQRWMARHLSEVADPDLLRATLETFHGEVRDETARRQIQASLRERLTPLAAASHESQLPLLMLLENTSQEAPLTAEELQSLERIAALPRYRTTSFARLYSDAERRMKVAGIKAPVDGAFMAAVGELALVGPMVLFKRVGATTELTEKDRIRLGRVLWTLGERIAEGNTLVERLMGLRQMEQGAGLLPDFDVKRTAVTAELARGRAMVAASNQIHIDGWPLPSLHRDWLKASLDNEWKHLSALVAP
ncbi:MULTISPECIES: hypothetical protein [Corallococcus]|uniref:hypothetical protein n=1 Tax=Corallococcus TaxID=83461 RepID=UPI000EA32668|nr:MULTISPECIES: hypothetical protein [Corallococcus]NRD55859.1 hypothetical protein [Corallococcus exiguus]RKH22492.1 hypothetical protein D7V77_26875 [Corallococcus sp. CA041A]